MTFTTTINPTTGEELAAPDDHTGAELTHIVGSVRDRFRDALVEMNVASVLATES